MDGLRIDIDIGGTFTDFVVYDPAGPRLNTFKLLSTPGDPSQAVLTGLERILSQFSSPLPAPPPIIHGSTVATNALLERKGAACALATTRGFKDVLQIGRQNRTDLYNLQVKLPPALIGCGGRFDRGG